MAVEYLLRKGYRILDRNFYTRFGELDIVCEQDGKVIFVEVRGKRSLVFGTPEESITRTKIARLRKTALAYLADKTRHRFKGLRFDVVAIREDRGRIEINHIEGAF